MQDRREIPLQSTSTSADGRATSPPAPSPSLGDEPSSTPDRAPEEETSSTSIPPATIPPAAPAAPTTPHPSLPSLASPPLSFSDVAPGPPPSTGTDTTPASSSSSSSAPSRSSPAPLPPPPPAPSSAPAGPALDPSSMTASVALPAGDPSAGPLDPSSHYTFHRGVLSALTRMTVPSSSPTSDDDDSDDMEGRVDQTLLRRWLTLTPTFLLLDSSSHPSPSGLLSWQLGLQALINLMLALHTRNQLEWETMNAASRALAECWSICLCWTGMELAKGAVQGAGGKLKAVLDRDDPTRYKGRPLYPVEG